MRVAVIGAGWAGCAAAVEATRLGHQVTLYETTRVPGGRARRVGSTLAGEPIALDNGQHILIGAYADTLQLMGELGVDVSAAFLRMPLTLQFPDGTGLTLPDWPAPLDALAGIVGARGWNMTEKLSLLKLAAGWRLGGFQCAPEVSVADLCRGLAPRVMDMLIAPLCVSALNTPTERSSGQVFLRVMHDALFAESGGSNLLLPRQDLSALLPEPAIAWLQKEGAAVYPGTRALAISQEGAGWVVQTDNHSADHSDSPAETSQAVDAVVLACPPLEAARLANTGSAEGAAWAAAARSLHYEALTTVYAHREGARLAQPMLALRDGPGVPAQFVFDRGQLDGPAGLLAFVISASTGDSAELTQQVLAQASAQLGLSSLTPVQTIVEKRATFACTPGLQRPAANIEPGLLACGDYVQGPYPATLEGAVRSGLQAARHLH